MSICDWFRPKRKIRGAAVYETPLPINSQENQQTVRSGEDEKSAERAKALSDIWMSVGSQSEIMPPHTKLWHGGTVSKASELDNSRSLWCTNDSTKAHHYDGTARGDGMRKNRPPVRLTLTTVRELKLANFAGASLQKFTMQHCNFHHDKMNAALRDWCLLNSFDGVTNINHGSDEVVVCFPGNDLEIKESMPL